MKENMIKESNLLLTQGKDNINNLNNLDNKLITSQKTNLNCYFEDSKTKLNKNIINNDSYKKYDESIEVTNNNKIINNNNLKNDNDDENNVIFIIFYFYIH